LSSQVHIINTQPDDKVKELVDGFPQWKEQFFKNKTPQDDESDNPDKESSKKKKKKNKNKNKKHTEVQKQEYESSKFPTESIESEKERERERVYVHSQIIFFTHSETKKMKERKLVMIQNF
jgi:hypothetical protein